MPDTAGQDFAVRILKSHIAKDRLAHTYLFTGGLGAAQRVGTRPAPTLARDFAKALLCEKNRVFESCDCVSCRKIENQNHPDVCWLGRDADARSIKIETVREMLGWANLKPYEGRRKVCVFLDAERLTHEAQNALLRTLEEPPGDTVFCLLVESKSHLLETISSRAFEIRLPPGENEAPLEVGATHASPLQGIQEKNWDDFLEPFQTTPREELKPFLDALMHYFRNEYERLSVGAGLKPAPTMHAWLEALDAVYETKEALEANANQKLAMTRLTMKLQKLNVGAKHASPVQ